MSQHSNESYFVDVVTRRVHSVLLAVSPPRPTCSYYYPLCAQSSPTRRVGTRSRIAHALTTVSSTVVARVAMPAHRTASAVRVRTLRACATCTPSLHSLLVTRATVPQPIDCRQPRDAGYCLHASHGSHAQFANDAKLMWCVADAHRELRCTQRRYSCRYFNAAKRQCLAFMHSGCGGNANAFVTRVQCEHYCRAQADGQLLKWDSRAQHFFNPITVTEKVRSGNASSNRLVMHKLSSA